MDLEIGTCYSLTYTRPVLFEGVKPKTAKTKALVEGERETPDGRKQYWLRESSGKNLAINADGITKATVIKPLRFAKGVPPTNKGRIVTTDK